MAGVFDFGDAYLEQKRWAAENARREEEQSYLRQQRAKAAQRESAVDAAFNSYETLRTKGNVNAEGTGLSAPSAQMAFAGNAGAYGSGEAAVQEMAGDYAREMGRFAQAPGAPAGGLPTYNPTAPVTTTAASEVDLEAALGGIAAAQRDVRGIRESTTNVKNLKLDAGRKAEFKRLQDLDDEALANVFEKQSKDGSGFNGMLTFSPERNEFLFTSKIPGIPSQVLSRAELMQQMMGLWEAGNGDYAKGLDIMVKGAQTRRDLENQQYTRAAGVAQGNADLHYKGRKATLDEREFDSNSAYRTGMLGLQRDRFEREKYQLINPSMQYKRGPKGELIPVITGLRLGQTSGAYEPVAQELSNAPGLIPPEVFNPTRYAKTAESMVGQPTGRVGPDRKPVMHTMESATQTLMDQAAASYSPVPDSGLPAGRVMPGQGPAAPATRAPAQAPATRAPAPQAVPSSQNPNSWLYRPGGSAPAQQGQPMSLVDLYRQRQYGLPEGVSTSGLGYTVDGRAYFDREEAIRAAQGR
jgi:hypothetical protein